MLTQLTIKNIVLIDSAEIALGEGLCVLTGETGAGKSILLDALGLALGARGDASLVRHGETQGAVTAEFDIRGNAGAKAALEALELEPEDVIIIRRTLGADGKTRCMVNDQPVSVSGLKRLGETLVEVHGQHDQRGLMDASTHRALLDEYGHHAPLLAQVSAAYKAWHEASASLAKLHAELEQARREEEYLRHIAGELKALNPQADEEDTLTDQRTAMMQSEKLFETLNEALAEITQGKNVTMALRAAQRILSRSTLSADGRFNAVIDALDKAAEAADDAHAELEDMGKNAPYDPQKLEQIEERLFALKDASRKYHLPISELPDLREQAEQKLTTLANNDKEMAALTKAEAAAKAAFIKVAATLTQAREKASAKLEKAILAELEPLKMGGTRFRAHIIALPESSWSAAGVDAVAFEAATNVTKKSDIPFAPLSKIASGGELSRFMLAIKVAMSELRSTPTLIFDEIDTGTGGAVADAIGQRLARLGASAQVLVVTHLPQVAARGAQHLVVRKEEQKGKITTSVSPLSKPERKEELARMLAGATVTNEARKAAQKLLEHAA